KERLPLGCRLQAVVHRERVLCDERRRIWIGRLEQGDAAWPNTLSDFGRRMNEVEYLAALGIDARRRVFERPPAVVVRNGMHDGFAARMIVQRDALLHDGGRELGVLGLRDELEVFAGRPDDHACGRVEGVRNLDKLRLSTSDKEQGSGSKHVVAV